MKLHVTFNNNYNVINTMCGESCGITRYNEAECKGICHVFDSVSEYESALASVEKATRDDAEKGGE